MEFDEFDDAYFQWLTDLGDAGGKNIEPLIDRDGIKWWIDKTGQLHHKKLTKEEWIIETKFNFSRIIIL